MEGYLLHLVEHMVVSQDLEKLQMVVAIATVVDLAIVIVGALLFFVVYSSNGFSILRIFSDNK